VGAIAQHGEQHVAASSRNGDQRLIVTLALLEIACWRNSRGEQYFKALCGCDSL
jgi:hypothetical protein